jgi:hypothetical protein
MCHALENMASVDLLQKLCAHERSARKIGSIAEANAFALRIGRMVSEREIRFASEISTPAPRSYAPPPQYRYRPTSTSWHNEPATDKQLRTVQKLYKRDAPMGMTKGEAHQLIQSFFGSQGVRS